MLYVSTTKMIDRRLNLVDANLELLTAAVAGGGALEVLLGVAVADDWAGFPEALPVLRAAYAENPNEHAWGSLFFVDRHARVLVGLGGFKGPPSPDGVVEIGYAIAPAFQGQGLATDAVAQMLQRAFADPIVRAVDAHTLGHTNPSTRVLEKSGFLKIGEATDPDAGLVWHWRCEGGDRSSSCPRAHSVGAAKTWYVCRRGNVNETWRSPKPEEAYALLSRTAVPWWFAGGWALDLFLGADSRPHSDLDIGCFRADLGGLLEQLSGWDIRVAADGRLARLHPGSSIASTAHGLWCRPSERSAWVLEILVEDTDGLDWTFRRDRRIRRPAKDIVARTTSGLQIIRPEIQLLYKSKNHRPCDDLDFSATWSSLGPDAQLWLVEHLQLISPNHPWLLIGDAG